MSEEMSGSVRKARRAHLDKVVEQIQILDDLDDICLIDQDDVEQCSQDLFNIISSIKIRDLPEAEAEPEVRYVRRRRKK